MKKILLIILPIIMVISIAVGVYTSKGVIVYEDESYGVTDVYYFNKYSHDLTFERTSKARPGEKIEAVYECTSISNDTDWVYYKFGSSNISYLKYDEDTDEYILRK